MPRIRNISIALLVALMIQIFGGYIGLGEKVAEAAGEPTLSILPTTGADITPNSEIILTFNEPVRRGTGTIKIMRDELDPVPDTEALAYNISGDMNNIQWAANNKVVIKLAASLTTGNYYILIPAGAFFGVTSDKAFPGYLDKTGYQFQIVTLTAKPDFPYNATAVNVDADNSITLILNFDRHMNPGKGYIRIKRSSDNTEYASINVESPVAVTIENTTTPVINSKVSIPIPKLENSTNYYVVIDPGAFVDLANNKYDGMFNPTAWSFKTEDKFDDVAPTATSFSPAIGGTIGQLATGALSITFNEKIYIGSGTIGIKKASDNSLFCSIPVSSSPAVTKDTTETIITIKPSDYACPSFVNGTLYKVEIGATSFRDATGNYYVGTNAWTFTASVDNAAPVPVTYVPAVSATVIPINTTTFSITFNEDVNLSIGLNTVIFPQNNPTSSTQLILSQDSNKKKVIFTKASGPDLLPNTKYAITIPSGVIKDLVNNPFAGILNSNQWTFDTAGVANVPTLSKAEMEGSTIVLTYSEQLDTTKIPYAENFYVTVNNVPQSVSGVSVASNQVRVVMQTGVIVGQIVKISYFPDNYSSARRIQSLQAKEAAGLSNRDVTNTADTTLPRPLSGTASGTIVSLNFNKPLAALGSSAKDQFYVVWGGQVTSVTSISLSGSTLLLTLPSVTSTTTAISVSYSPGSYPLRDLAGNPVSSFSNFQILNPYDVTAPSLTSATAIANKITLTYNEALRSTVNPVLSSFSVLVNGQAAVIYSVAINNNSVELVLAQTLTNNSIVIVSYIPSTNPVADLVGNPAPAFNGYQIVGAGNNIAKVSTAIFNGTTLTLNYTASLNSSTTPLVGQYILKADGANMNIANVSVSGTQVNLMVTSQISSSQRITISYFNVGSPLKDATGQVVEPFTDLAVTNQSTTSGGNLPDYLEANGTNGIRMNTKATTKSVFQTASGRTVNKYTVDGDKLTAAFNAIKTGSGNQAPQITFQVPSAEAGAFVSLPIRGLMDSATKIYNGVFTIEYDGSTYEFPLKAINYTQLVQSIGNNIISAQLMLKIERSSDSALVTAVNSQGGQLVGSPIDFSAVISSNGTDKAITDYDTYVSRSITVNSSGSTGDLAVVRLDAESGDVIYVPTRSEVSGNTTKVHFSRRGNSVYAVVHRSPVSFNDMTKHWARTEVSTLAAKFIVEGTSAGKFEPGKNITRADFAEFIARGLGLTGNRAAANKYGDVGTRGVNTAYIGAVSLAGIVEGGTDGKFRPNAPVTREEMATMLVRAMKYAGVSTTASSTALNGFKDRNKIGSWAKDGMAICVTAGFIKGSPTQQINPQSNATRAEAAIMVKRFLEYVDFL
ncbi:Ig-like domain-containing protein [Cohnella silvisoli]|uniref:SwmB domain-containing protein n=1 Tax=Cohnella silvisoli TaxID=2873699 RepID=A0ABV1KQ06_9BACL|nr:SwmB domain-containing protein [Cohnella silvisoli]MCD9022291.1 Ig-like domain-containing protein [Cohnella silvisoli]